MNDEELNIEKVNKGLEEVIYNFNTLKEGKTKSICKLLNNYKEYNDRELTEIAIRFMEKYKDNIEFINPNRRTGLIYYIHFKKKKI